MSRRRRYGKLRKLDRSKRRSSSGILVARDLEDAERKARPLTSLKARRYRGPESTIVVWQGGKFRLVPGHPKYVKSLAKPPRGLAERIQIAIKEGKTSG